MGSMGVLRKLGLAGNQIGDVGMQAFADAIGSGSMGNLKVLYLNNNQISDAGMTAFSSAVTSGSMGNLNRLFINHPSRVLKDACASRNIRLNF